MNEPFCRVDTVPLEVPQAQRRPCPTRRHLGLENTDRFARGTGRGSHRGAAVLHGNGF